MIISNISDIDITHLKFHRAWQVSLLVAQLSCLVIVILMPHHFHYYFRCYAATIPDREACCRQFDQGPAKKASPAIQNAKQQLSLHFLLTWLFSYLLKWFCCNCNQDCFSAFLSYKCVPQFLFSTRGWSQFFGKEKITPRSLLFCIYKQSY